MDASVIIYLYCFFLLLLSIYIRTGKRDYSRKLYQLNLSLLVLFILMLFLRLFSEFLLIFEIKTKKILIIEFYITPMSPHF